jgi:uncharacterized membrane protein YgcG
MINLFTIAHAVTISASIPGTYDTSNAAATSPGAFIADFYQYALVIGGILAFGVIVYGGIRYMTSAGNPSGQGDAKEWIQAAIMGILLLAGAYFILKVINPNLVNLNLPSLQSVGQTNTSGGTGSAAGSGTSGGGTTTPGNGFTQPPCTVCGGTCGAQTCQGTQRCINSAGTQNPNYSCGYIN